MTPVSLALFWHQHQPYYPDDLSGDNPFPWVRLHGTKDYIGMALHLLEVPEFHCTINLVPSLLDQIRRYTEQGGTDRHLDVSRINPDSFSANDTDYLLDHFFMANPDWMIHPYPRYRELFAKRRPGKVTAEQARSEFSIQEMRDLQVWSNLTWMHNLLFEQDAELAEFRRKGRGWSETEKNWLLDRQLEVLRQIIPLHRRLSERGQVELTTTPFYHPILPLLCDKRSAREAMPGCDLPRYTEAWPEDGAAQIRRAIVSHRELFGVSPRGMWPSEGSVSQAMLDLAIDAGIEWIATDEEILAHSTDGFVSRDAHGHQRRPEMLYRPWHAGEGERTLQIVFRDHGLSDLIGFRYQHQNPALAAADLLNRVREIGLTVARHAPDQTPLVPIILDGENCWEYYPDGGVEFLRTLYRSAAADAAVCPVRMSDHLDEYPATDRIQKLFAGSWISHNFAIWIGHEEDRLAWDLLHETRSFLQQCEATRTADPARLGRAWNEIHIAEGSDWFWWYGDDHNCAQDALFDHMFRRHLQNVYVIMEAAIPSRLHRPITQTEQRVRYTRPRGFLSVKMNSNHHFFEWRNAGVYEARNERGTMAANTRRHVRGLAFGFDARHLFVRVDTEEDASQIVRSLRLCLVEPPDVVLSMKDVSTPIPDITLNRGGAQFRTDSGVACHERIEIAAPLADLDVASDDTISFFVEIETLQGEIERVPAEGDISLAVPPAHFDDLMWQA